MSKELSKEEHDKKMQEIMDKLYPKDRERWYLIKIKDQDKCFDAFPWVSPESRDKEYENLGYEINAMHLGNFDAPVLSELYALRAWIAQNFDNDGMVYETKAIFDEIGRVIEDLKHQIKIKELPDKP